MESKRKMGETKILATMGPTLQTVEQVEEMIKRGVKQFRIHMGLRTRDFVGYYRKALNGAEKMNEKIEVLLDLPSSRPRIDGMDEYTYTVNEYAYIYDRDEQVENINNYVNIPLPVFKNMISGIKAGDKVIFRDGHVVFIVESICENSILAKCVKADKWVKTGSSSCFPDSDIVFSPIDEIDIEYLRKMKDEGMCPDKVAISFASNKEQIEMVRKELFKIWDNNKIKIICKIESKLGLRNIDELLDNSDGIMIARGDLLLCIAPYKLPKIQMELANICKSKKKILIIATEFFERYAESGIVNRAELSDVALAVRQNADSIMLARETGNSCYAYGCVEIINQIIESENK